MKLPIARGVFPLRRSGPRGPTPPASEERAGFTLVEALVAVTLGAIVIGLAVSVMIAQGGYYQGVTERTGLQGTVRSVADLMREDLQGVTYRGITSALTDEIVFRAPLSMGVVCPEAVAGNGNGKGGPPGKGGLIEDVSAYLPLPPGGDLEDRVTGWGRREGTDWTYFEVSWDDLQNGGGDPLLDCALVGADTVDGGGEFRALSLGGGKGKGGGGAEGGDVIVIVSEVEYVFQESQLRPGTLALFRREGEGALVELATGLGEASGFAYRLAGGEFQPQYPGAQRAEVVEVRVTVVAEGPERTYEQQFRVPLRNAPEE